MLQEESVVWLGGGGAQLCWWLGSFVCLSLLGGAGRKKGMQEVIT